MPGFWWQLSQFLFSRRLVEFLYRLAHDIWTVRPCFLFPLPTRKQLLCLKNLLWRMKETDMAINTSRIVPRVFFRHLQQKIIPTF